MYNIWLNSLKKKHDLQWVEDLWTQSTYIYMDTNLVEFFNRLFFSFILVDQLWVILQYRLKTVETDCWDYVKGDLHDCLVEVIT